MITKVPETRRYFMIKCKILFPSSKKSKPESVSMFTVLFPRCTVKTMGHKSARWYRERGGTCESGCANLDNQTNNNNTSSFLINMTQLLLNRSFQTVVRKSKTAFPSL